MKKKIEEIMTKNVISAKKDDSLLKIAKLFKENKISGVPVLNKKEEVVGIISKSDVLRVFEDFNWRNPLIKAMDILHLHDEKLHDIEHDIKNASKMKVSDVMSKDPHTMDLDELIDDAAMIMHSSGFNRLPVVDKDNRLIGIVTRADIISSLYDI